MSSEAETQELNKARELEVAKRYLLSFAVRYHRTEGLSGICWHIRKFLYPELDDHDGYVFSGKAAEHLLKVFGGAVDRTGEKKE